MGSLYGFRRGEGQRAVPRSVLLGQLVQGCVYGRMEPELKLEQNGDRVVDDALDQLNETRQLLN